MAEFVKAASIEEQLEQGITVLIIGDSGVGKTTMAASFPAPVFIDVDHGADFVDAHRIVPRSKRELEETIQTLEAAFRRPDCPWKTIVLDTLDEALALYKESILGGSDKMSMSDWDRLLNQFMPMLRRLKRIKAHFVMCGQTKLVSMEEEKQTMWSLALQSSARVQVPQLAGWVLHLVPGPDGVPVALTKPSRKGNVQYMAKDRSGRLPTTIVPAWDALIKALDSTVEAHSGH